MGLKDDIQTDVGEAFDFDLSDAVVSFQVVKDNDLDYDPVFGKRGSSSVVGTGRGVLDPLNDQREFDTGILLTDVGFLMLANEVTIEPEVGLAIVDNHFGGNLDGVPTDKLAKMVVYQPKDSGLNPLTGPATGNFYLQYSTSNDMRIFDLPKNFKGK